MNKQQFTKYISENFDCSKEAAGAIIELFSESIYMAISEGYEVNLDHFGKFAIKNLHSNKAKPTPYFTPSKDLKVATVW